MNASRRQVISAFLSSFICSFSISLQFSAFSGPFSHYRLKIAASKAHQHFYKTFLFIVKEERKFATKNWTLFFCLASNIALIV